MASGPTIAVAGDSVLATSLPTFGTATIQATRPDALTGAPVVIGVFSGTANPSTPFSVNTTTPTPLNPSGDCWQKGALSQALTPDLQPGDTVTLSQAALLGGGSTSTSVKVPAAANGTSGPISGCSAIAPWAHNAITSAPSTVTGGAITVSGVAQPLATGVSVSATDGTHSTTPVSTTPGSSGSWSATIPATQVAKLADAPLTVTPVVAVPDVSTGAAAHIAGVGVKVTKAGSPASSGQTGPGSPSTSKPGSGPTSSPSSAHRRIRVSGLRVPSTLTLARARRTGISVSFLVPVGAKVVRVELLRGKTRLSRTTVRAHKARARQRVVVNGKRLTRRLRAGSYTIAIQAGGSSASLGPVATRHMRIR
jgi:hypothetical protein